MKLSDPIFTNAEAAREHLEHTRWPNGPECPHCGTVNEATRLAGKAHRPGVFQCNACREQFTATVGTVFERSKVPLNKWLLASYMMSASKKGVSALQLQRQLGVTYKTAWFMAHRLREAMAPTTPPPLGGWEKTVEADEAYIGGKERNKHASKRRPGGEGGRHMAPVVTLVERGGHARSFYVANVTASKVRPIVTKHTDRMSKFYTDEAPLYRGMGQRFRRHRTVTHSRGEYVRDEVHSNTVESYFAILKRGIYGTFHSISEAHLHRYLAEFDFRYNNRSALGVDDTQRTDEMLRQIAGKRLTYRRTRESENAQTA